ncbi:tumor necrosis factor receptor superfamily member 6-like [Sebastes fasciatus]|uniref:tumor necrosis factor receptor superfamily member 6-like n=1 Tax=Sebastes fasciatus TaxID=394691 RepID=UPI003D9F4FC3
MMMAADSSKFPVWFTAFTVLLCLLVSGSSSAADLKDGSQCVDGTYEHTGGLTCCLCGAGLHLESHCIESQTYGECKACVTGQFSSHPTSQISCDLCRSCSQISADVEEDEPCKPDADTKCRCKKGHYCGSDTEICRTCVQCEECGDVGIKVACTARTNTVCNEKTEEGITSGAIVGIVVAILFVIGLALGLFWKWRRDQKRRREHSLAQQPKGSADDVERQPLKDLVPVVDLQPHMTDIAEAIGWRDMRDVAMRSCILDTIIESCVQTHPGNSQEQTLELLQIWVEKQGSEASKNLVQILEDNGKKSKAESVVQILARPNPPA